VNMSSLVNTFVAQRGEQPKEAGMTIVAKRQPRHSSQMKRMTDTQIEKDVPNSDRHISCCPRRDHRKELGE
jgi:hypothetical protein